MSEIEVSGLTVVITGAASGIGKALAEGFLRDGAQVMACDVAREGYGRLRGHYGVAP